MVRRVLGLVLAGLLAVACSAEPPRPPATSSPATSSPATSSPATSSPDGREDPGRQPSPNLTGPALSDGRPARALLTIARIGIRDLPVLPYRGRTDDAPGTEIQDRGVAASPHGPVGGVGPGGLGNYQVTAHRLSSTKAFLHLPRLRRGDRVVVEVGKRRYVYRITATRQTSFRSAKSLRAQRAAVPGKPGAEPTQAMITLSTCATPEDRAAGNNWSDRFGNPEHRIDKIGVLVTGRTGR